MKKRKLGNSGIDIAPLTFGGNVFGWTIDENTSYNLLDAFVHGGFNCIDTADVYSRWKPGNKGGESETIIGNWMKKRNNRSDVIIATKVGSDMGSGKKDISKKYILKAVDESLKRLQTDHIDLYQTHWDDDVTPVEETLEAYGQLIKEGKVRAIGASNLSPKRLQDSLDASFKYTLPRYETFQPLYNLYDRKPYEEALEDICVKNSLGVITYYSLASGFLTGKYRKEEDFTNEKSQRSSGVKKYLNERGKKILAALDEVAKSNGTTDASVAIAWIIARSSVTSPIASATKIEQLNDLMNAANLSLSEDDISKLNKVSAWR